MARQDLSGESRRPPGAVWMVGLALLQVLLFLVLFGAHHRALVDDAFISFRYAARWAHGAGLTYNDGSRVEGFSNPLWTFGLGALDRLGLSPDRAAPAVGLAAFLAVGLAGWVLARVRRFSSSGSLLLAGGLALDVGLGLWAGSGLETASAALLVALWLVAAARRGRPRGFAGGALLGLGAAALALSRPEGWLWAGWGLLWLVWGAWVPGRALAGAAAGFLPALGYEAFRWGYYRRPVPNTFFAKLEPGGRPALHGLADLGGWAWSHAPMVAAALALWFLVRRGGRPSRPPASPAPSPRLWLLLPSGWLALQAGFVILAGGDWMGRTRYPAPLLPAFFLLAAEGWERVRPRWGLRGAAVLVAATTAMGWGARDRIPDYTRVGAELGRWLRMAAAPGDTLAITAAGAVPYYSGLPTYDVLGINDPAVAGRAARDAGGWAPGHQRYDLDRLLELEPRWIVWDYGVKVNERRLREYAGWEGDPDRLGFRRSLLARARFRDRYGIDRAAPASTQGAYTVFRRKD